LGAYNISGKEIYWGGAYANMGENLFQRVPRKRADWREGGGVAQKEKRFSTEKILWRIAK